MKLRKVNSNPENVMNTGVEYSMDSEQSPHNQSTKSVSDLMIQKGIMIQKRNMKFLTQLRSEPLKQRE
jgi:hypothetical protein